jgi:hypothetical protein
MTSAQVHIEAANEGRKVRERSLPSGKKPPVKFGETIYGQLYWIYPACQKTRSTLRKEGRQVNSLGRYNNEIVDIRMLDWKGLFRNGSKWTQTSSPRGMADPGEYGTSSYTVLGQRLKHPRSCMCVEVLM